MNLNKSIGPNSIPKKILKLLKNEISSHLSDICNISFFLWFYSHQSWKLPKLFLYIKKDSKLDCKNYRPIYLLPNIEKFLEKFVHNRITKFLDNNNLIYPLQFGFRHNHSTIHALINLRKDTRENLDEGKVGCCIFVDLQKAFDTVDHNILLVKLEHYWTYGFANDCFKSYLSDRKQFVSINGFNSSHAWLKHRVLQGSVLAPILFLIYINNLNYAINYCKVHHFPDNTNLLHFNSSIKKRNRLVNLDMKHLSFWLNASKRDAIYQIA